MKSNDLPKNFPGSREEWEKLVSEAPERVEDPECPYDPNDKAAVDEYWKDPIVSRSASELREKLTTRRRRGPQKTPLKVPTTIRFDADVLAALKATGKGWQTRVNEAMREWVKAQNSGRE